MKTEVKKRRKKVTLEDIAREAGCSKVAVSYVINKNHTISPELTRRINEIIEKKHYIPSLSNRVAKPREIAVLTMDLPGIRHGLWEAEIRKRGFVPRRYFLPENPEKWQKDIAIINRDKNIVGIICLHPEIQSIDLLRLCKNQPSVIFSRENSMLSFSQVSYKEFGRIAAGEILRFGHEKVGLVYHSRRSVLQQELIDSFLEKFDEKNIHTIALRKTKTYEEILSFEKLDAAVADGVTVFFTVNTLPLATWLLRWAYNRKLFIPDDISLFALDHDQQGGFMIPPVSNVSFDLEKMIPLTVKNLIARIRGYESESLLIEPKITDFGSLSFPKLKK